MIYQSKRISSLNHKIKLSLSVTKLGTLYETNGQTSTNTGFCLYFRMPAAKWKEITLYLQLFLSWNFRVRRSRVVIGQPIYSAYTNTWCNFLSFIKEFMSGSISSTNRFLFLFIRLSNNVCSNTFMNGLCRETVLDDRLRLLKILRFQLIKFVQLVNANTPSIIKICKTQKNSNK